MINEILQFIEARKSSKVFGGWRISDPSHRRYVMAQYAAGLLFTHVTPSGQVDGIGIVEPVGDNQFYIPQLIADSGEARRCVISSFLKKFPGASVVGYQRRGKQRVVRDSKRLLQLMTS